MNSPIPSAAPAADRYEEEIRSLCVEVLDRYEEVTLVYRLCERLGSVLGEEAIAQLVLDDAARTLGARTGDVWLTGDDGPRLAAAVPQDRPSSDVTWDRAPQCAAGTGRSFLADPAPGQGAVVAVPLPSAAGEPIGALVLRAPPGGRPYRAGDVKLLTALASLMSAFIRNTRLAAEVRRAEIRKREDEIARQVHLGLLPRSDPEVPGLSIVGGHRAAESVGGDYYGYLSLPGGLRLVMADVSGHGVAAALYMAAAKGALQAEARREPSPATVFERTNDVLAADFSESDVFATAVLFRFAPGGERVAFSNAGHNPPVLVRRDGRVERLDRGGSALGLFPGMKYEEDERAFDPGDVLVVYTDGLVEARDPSRGLFGIERLIEVAVRARSDDAARIRERILQVMAEHCAGVPPGDDVTLVVVKRVLEESFA
jgi:sigma-B regulation protein RsbU (phosphoserine phosphatase)